MGPFVPRLSGFSSLVGVVLHLAVLDSSQRRGDLRGVFELASVANIIGVPNVVRPGGWRESNRLDGVVPVVWCTQVLYSCVTCCKNRSESGWFSAT